MNPLIQTITSRDPAIRDRSVRGLVAGLATTEVLGLCDELETFRRGAENLYERVRAAMFLHALYRYSAQESPAIAPTGFIPFSGVEDLHARRFEQAVSEFLDAQRHHGPNGAIASALAQAYEQIAYQTLADQVRRSVRSCPGSRWMFRVGAADELPLKLHPRLLAREGKDGLFPILVERTPVRLDLSHSAWSDIFFLGMDYPEGARVINISVDLAVHGRDSDPRPPIETFCRVIAEPILRLTSIDLNATKDVATLDELFNFGNDYLGLVKAGVVASGLIPPSLEGTGPALGSILGRVIRPGYGLEVVSKVNDIPKGSRLAVSTNLLASLISLLMRAGSQARNLTGPLEPDEARVVVSRAILGEWLGGSGGGWQDSGGVFPGVKLIRGVAASERDPEWGVSRGCLLPEHELIRDDTRSESREQRSRENLASAADAPDDPVSDVTSPISDPESFDSALARSLVLVHGGMAQNVGPILNMVTEKYLLRRDEEWAARREALAIFEEIVAAVRSADVRAIGDATTRNWEGPLKRIIPWVSNAFTEAIIAESKAALGDDFWGFLMLGGMSGGGMGFFVAPHRRDRFRDEVREIMLRAKTRLDDALPFAMDPVVYNFKINRGGTVAELVEGQAATMPPRYYALQVGAMIAEGAATIDAQRKADIDHFANHCPDAPALLSVFRTMVNRLFPVARSAADPTEGSADAASETIRRENGFDAVQHAQLRDDLQRGRIGLARNRLPDATDIRDVADTDLIDASGIIADRAIAAGEAAIRRGEVAAVTLAAGVGSRWTTGAGVVKAVNPFVVLDGRHRAFLEIHLAKTRATQARHGVKIPHVVTTSFLTHGAIERHLARTANYGHDGPVVLSRGQSIGQRLVPMVRGLQFLWEEQGREKLDENKQKVREASRRAIMDWAVSRGEGSDYTENVPIQRFNPPGHFYEVPNMLKNGVLAGLLAENPNLRWLMVHNVDTLGASLDPGILGLAIESKAMLGFEVIPRRIDDRGGGLARVEGRVRLLEGLAQPREDVEFRLRYYNTLTTWVKIDGLLAAFGLCRNDLADHPAEVAAAVRAMAARVPTYVTIKDVKRRWGHGQEDVFPVTQFEKLWGDLSALPEIACGYLAVDRRRGQQLKDAAQLDGWARDGGLDYVRGLCAFPS